MSTEELPSAPEKPRRRWLRSLLIDLLIVLLILGGVEWWRSRSLPHGPAPALAGITLDGRTIDLQAQPGSVRLVQFWATWCPVCRLSEGAIDRIAQDYPVVTVALQSGSDADLDAYLRQHELGFPVLSDPDGVLARQWQVSGVPGTFILDEAGNIRFALVGYHSGPGLRLRLWLATWMK